ncbi:MAG: hypothetical protein EA411_11830 [Saprospirales bacterium]|nr:MAG: hypothetical protein EA411_11830 [Saprospirales bacterium]
MKVIGFISVFLFLSSSLNSQNEERALFFNVKYGVQVPGGDLSDRFSTFFSAGIDPEFYHGGRNLFAGFQFNFLFGQNVKEDPLAAIRDSQGEIIGRDQNYALIDPRMRGLTFGGHVGKLFPFASSDESKWGIRLSLGTGVMLHRIALKDENDTANQIRDNYGKGYNRKTVGGYLHQFAGIQYMSADRRINFRAGFTFHQGFTESVRAVDFDTKETDTRSRIDLMNGFEMSWILPIFFSEPDVIIYY